MRVGPVPGRGLGRETPDERRPTSALPTLGWGIYDLDRLKIQTDGDVRWIKLKNAASSLSDLGPLVLSDFFNAIDHKKAPIADPESVLPSLRLINMCYERRTRFDVPGHAFEMEPSVE